MRLPSSCVHLLDRGVCGVCGARCEDGHWHDHNQSHSHEDELPSEKRFPYLAAVWLFVHLACTFDRKAHKYDKLLSVSNHFFTNSDSPSMISESEASRPTSWP